MNDQQLLAKRYQINDFDYADFLQNYWQQKPLLIRNAFPNFSSPLSADELAGLACEQSLESRLIVEKTGHWQLENGPLTEQTFAQLPEKDWTILVQAVDHVVPDVANLMNYFRFIPNWRIDDIMVSYAAEGGNVGPHYDNYDVFLLQGSGQRKWQVGSPCSSISELQNNDQLRLLTDFEYQNEWVLSPGDLLYLPPLYSHWGKALDNDCMTYSIGFRAPSHAELLSGFCDHQIDQLTEELRYSDANMTPQHCGEITPATLAAIQKILAQQLTDPRAVKQWFGQFITEPKYPQHVPSTNQDWHGELQNHDFLIREPSSRFAFIRNQETATIYINGQAFDDVSHSCAELLTEMDHYATEALMAFLDYAPDSQLIEALIQTGHLYGDNEDIN